MMMPFSLARCATYPPEDGRDRRDSHRIGTMNGSGANEARRRRECPAAVVQSKRLGHHRPIIDPVDSFRRRRRPLPMISKYATITMTDRTRKRRGRRESGSVAASIHGGFLLLLLSACCCWPLLSTSTHPFVGASSPSLRTASTVSHHHRHHHTRRHHHRSPCRKRRNNTGFYYGIRDDDMLLSTSLPARISQARFKPVMNSLSARLHEGLSHHFSTLTSQQQQQAEASSGDSTDSLCHDKMIVRSEQAQTRQQWLRTKMANCISQSLVTNDSLMPSENGQWNDKLGRRGTGPVIRQGLNNNWSDIMTSKALSLLGGSGINSAVSHHHQLPRHDIIMDASSSAAPTKQQQPRQQKQKKRRKNNTGFYYGIRENVLARPEDETRSRGAAGVPQRTKGAAEEEGGVAKGTNKDGGTQAPPKLDVAPPPRLMDEEQPSPKKRRQRNNSNNNRNNNNEDGSEKKKNTPPPRRQNKKNSNKSGEEETPGMSDVLSETLFELREMREEIVALREELRAVKDKTLRGDEPAAGTSREQQRQAQRKQRGQQRVKEEKILPEEGEPPPSIEQEQPVESYEEEMPLSQKKVSKRDRRRHLEQVGRDVEEWATNLLFEEEGQAADGWKQISCNNFVKKKFNKFDRTQVYLKWMPDSRDERDIESNSPASEKSNAYPCLKCRATIDAPLDRVCSFLANPDTVPLYNELVVDHSDVEEITPSSKITWTKCPKILFVKPRDFVTYCSHRWRGDGTQVIVNQACEHEDVPGVMVEGQGDVCRGFAIRGANFISKDPDDPDKTRITMISHATPGGGLPQWAMNTAVNAVVQVEPFKFFHNINDSICNYQQELTASRQPQTSNVGNLPGRSDKPAGIAHLGFTCFWPNGGGLKEPQQEDVLANEDVDDSTEELD